MKVLFVIGALQGGGAETQLRHLAAALVAQGDTVTVALLGRDTENVSLPGAQVERLRGHGEGWLKVIRAFRRLAQAHDVVYSFMDIANVFSSLALMGVPVPQVWGLRSAGFASGRFGKPAAVLGIWLSRRAVLAVCNAGAVSTFYEGLGYRPARWVTIPNGVDTDRFRPTPPKAGHENPLAEQTLKVAMVGRADPIKHHDRFLTLADALHEVFPAVRWTIAGRGTDSPAGPVMTYLKAHAPKAPIDVRGAVAAMPVFYSACDLLVCCSDYEGASNVILEAMASGVPVVSFAVGDAPRMLDGCGVVVPPKDMDQLVAAVADLLRNAGLRKRFGEAGRRRACEAFSLDAMTSKTRVALARVAQLPTGDV